MDKHDSIEKFSLSNTETDVNKFGEAFKKHCIDNGISKEDFLKWKENFKMFVYENPTFDSGWERQYLANQFTY
jgi:hypothetical protein